jgi:hypothetical protein
VSWVLPWWRSRLLALAAAFILCCLTNLGSLVLGSVIRGYPVTGSVIANFGLPFTAMWWIFALAYMNVRYRIECRKREQS